MPKQKSSTADLLPIPVELIARRIYRIRGEKVMLDADLAELYQVTTGNLNLAVRRNSERFPEDFMFQLTKEEHDALLLQFARAKTGRGGRQTPPYAFTEHGVAMLSSVLNSKRAVQMNILIIRAFVQIRELLATNKDLAARVEKLEAGQACLATIVCLLIAPQRPAAQIKKSAPVFEAMKLELNRSVEQFKKLPTPPYFLSYEIVENEALGAAASFGALVSSNSGSRRRALSIDLRVGSFQLDNTHPIRGTGLNLPDMVSFYPMPVDDDPDALRALLWYFTDQKYKRAIEQLISVNTNVKVKVDETDRAGDFSATHAESYIEPAATALQGDRQVFENKVRKYSAPFQRHGNIYDSRATISANRETRWFISTDGAAVQTAETVYRLSIAAFSKADDGMELPRYESFYSSTLDGLPDDDTVLKSVDKMIADLRALKIAPLTGPYAGPAILSPRATGVFFHEIFGHRIEGQRSKRENEGQTFRDKVGQKVLPEFLSVYSDPTLRRLGKTELSGYYKFDNEGVKARRVTIVENGILKNFLMSRLPIDGFPESNGHGRRAPGFNVAGRQSNLLVAASKTVIRDELKKMLLEEVKKAGLEYGLYFEDIAGGFTMTGRTQPNAFEVIPVMVYRIYPDGHQELVRGVDLIGTPLTAFNKILAADNQTAAFNGICGAESGGVPVAAGGPGLLVAQVEVQKKVKSQERSPILGPPFDDKK